MEAGERVALVGSSGAGKTTLLDVVSGMVRATAGTASVLGVEPARLRGRLLRAHRSRIGTVGQHLEMALSLRVVHNVNAGRLGRWSTGAALWSLVRPSGRAAAADALGRVGLAERLWSRTDDLSGGERQRVAVSRVLLQRPELLLADEPTSSIDPRLSDDVMRLLCGAPGSAPWTALVSVHDPELARRHADRIVGLRHGRVAFDRPAAAVTETDLTELYRT